VEKTKAVCIAREIEKLLYYSVWHLDLDLYDKIYARNALMEFFGITEASNDVLTEEEEGKIKEALVPDEVLRPIGEYAVANKMCEGFELPNFFGKVMGFVTPAPSIVRDRFFHLATYDYGWELGDNRYEERIEKACDYLYGLCIKNNYIQKTAVDKNLYWKVDTDKGYIEVTVNLSKPERSNEETAKLLTMKASGYPKCMLCPENMGYFGGARQGTRQNMRYIPVTLDGEEWFWQYSPYLYYDEHCVIISEKHTPMKVDASTVRKLLDFVEVYPHYFAGSNASLPIVGGSILDHEHFQGGKHLMPVHNARTRTKYKSKRFDGVEISEVDWYNSVLRLESKDRKVLAEAVTHVIETWKDYRDESVGIIEKTDAVHNAVTPIARVKGGGTLSKKGGGVYSMDLILRNNRCSEEHPTGIFHAHKQYHNIKKESIGLIEAMGMFILPGRLQRETSEMKLYLTGEKTFNEKEFSLGTASAHIHLMKELLEKHGHKNTAEKAEQQIKDAINHICVEILKNTAVFKPDETGRKAWERFVEKLGIIEH
jgi:UDPglucose--hexose-1-phosphate uridylyltransferase